MHPKQLFERVAAHYQPFLAWHNKVYASSPGDPIYDANFWRGQLARYSKATGLILGIHLGTKAGDKYLLCLEADNDDADANLRAFIERHKVDNLNWTSGTGYLHALVRVEDGEQRLSNLGSQYQGIDLLRHKVIVPPFATSSGIRTWGKGCEERFLAGDVPELPDSALLELLQSCQRRMDYESLSVPACDMDYSWLADLGFEPMDDGGWRRPGSHTGQRSLVVDWPEPGKVTVFSTGIEQVEDTTYSNLVFYRLMNKLSMNEACTKWGVQGQILRYDCAVSYLLDPTILFRIANIRHSKKDGAKWSNPTFDLGVFIGDRPYGVFSGGLAATPTKHLGQALRKTLDVDVDETTVMLDQIEEAVRTKADELHEALAQRLEDGEEKHPGFNREVQSLVVGNVCKDHSIITWRRGTYVQPTEGYWYEFHDQDEYDADVRAYIDMFLGEDRTQTKDISEVQAAIAAKTLIRNGSRAIPPFHRETLEHQPYLLAFQDTAIDVRDWSPVENIGDYIFTDVIPFPFAEILNPSDRSSVEVIEAAFDQWWPGYVMQGADQMYYEVAGLLLSGLRPQIVPYFIGVPGSCKTSAVDALAATLPANRVINKTCAVALTGSHALDGVDTARLVVLQELDRGHLNSEAEAKIKALSGENAAEINPKYKQQKQVTLMNITCVTSNYEFNTTDSALLQRLYPIPFMHSIRDTMAENTEWLNVVLKPNIFGLYHYAVKGLRLLVERGGKRYTREAHKLAGAMDAVREALTSGGLELTNQDNDFISYDDFKSKMPGWLQDEEYDKDLREVLDELELPVCSFDDGEEIVGGVRLGRTAQEH